MVCKCEEMKNVKDLFESEGHTDTLIWSCLQGIMGEIYADNQENPTSAMAILGDFIFFAGRPNRELTLYKPKECVRDFIIMVPLNDAWESIIQDSYGDKAKKVTRYAIKKEQDIFDKEKLQRVVAGLSPEYSLKMIDEELFNQCRTIDWCRDWVAQYEDYDFYKKYGLGVAILKDEVPVSGASSYSGYRNGIEIEINTREDYRRKGLAYICGAKLILECLKRDWYPSWDAQNKWSAMLAQKLGYNYSHEYAAYEIWGY